MPDQRPLNPVPRPDSYESDFQVSEEYRSGMPDTQNAGKSAIKGSPVGIQQVGISNFRLPLRYRTALGDIVSLETAVTGTVGLGEGVRGINMSRIMRTFYTFRDRVFTLDLLEEVLEIFRREGHSSEARLRLAFRYPLLQRSLRSGLEGYQYYDTVLEGLHCARRGFRKRLHFDFVYSSACPGSADLATHAADVRGKYAIPHSQRSRARVSVEMRPDALVSPEELQQLCQRALSTEVQVMVRREDEQAFAEMNGAYTKFVEDAVRLLHAELDLLPQVRDFRIVCSHLESLHAHDAVGVLIKGVEGGFTADWEHFELLRC